MVLEEKAKNNSQNGTIVFGEVNKILPSYGPLKHL